MIWIKVLDFVKSKLTNATEFNKDNNGIVGKIIYGIILISALVMCCFKQNQDFLIDFYNFRRKFSCANIALFLHRNFKKFMLCYKKLLFLH